MHEPTERPKGYRFPKLIISYAVYFYHCFLLSYRDVQELMFKRGEVPSKAGIDVSQSARRQRVRDDSCLVF